MEVGSKRVPRHRLSFTVVNEIQDLILKHQFQPGDRLPSQRDLAHVFGVSSPVIREAIQALVDRGLLDVQHGSGTYVSVPSPDVLARSFKLHLHMNRDSIVPLHEVRTTLECDLAAFAAVRATDNDVLAIGEALARQETFLDDHNPDDEADLDFHLQIAKSAQNEIFLVFMIPLVDWMKEYRALAITSQEVRRISLEDHKRIYQAINRRRPEQAREEMRRHLERVKNLVVESLELVGKPYDK